MKHTAPVLILNFFFNFIFNLTNTLYVGFFIAYLIEDQDTLGGVGIKKVT